MPEHSLSRVRLAKMGENRKTGEKGRFRILASYKAASRNNLDRARSVSEG